MTRPYRRPADDPVTLIRDGRTPQPSRPTTDDRFLSIEDRLDRIEALALDVLDGLTSLSARLDKDA